MADFESKQVQKDPIRDYVLNKLKSKAAESDKLFQPETKTYEPSEDEMSAARKRPGYSGNAKLDATRAHDSDQRRKTADAIREQRQGSN